MKKILRRLSCLQANDRGFAMPLALGFGLVVILVATALLIRTNDDKATASLQRSADSSLNVTEAGVTKIMTFMNSNRLISVYDEEKWETDSVLNKITNGSDCSGISKIDVVSIAKKFASHEWQDIDPNDLSKGKFRLVDYTYKANDLTKPNSSPGEGELTVEGKLPDNQSVQNIKVKIPILNNITTTSIPGLWVANGGTGGNTIQGNVLLNDCTANLPTRITGTDPNTGQSYVARYTTRSFPDLPTLPTISSPPKTSDPNSLGSKISSNLTLPKATDRFVEKTTTNGEKIRVYQYLATSDVTIQSNGKITIDTYSSSLALPSNTRAVVAFYLQGSLLTQGGNTDIVHNCDKSSSGCRPTDFQMFGYGDSTKKICLNGTELVDAFILAPKYTAGVSGSGGGKGGFRGAVWVNDWSTGNQCGSNTINTTVTQTANWNLGDLPFESFVLPQLSPIKDWRRQEAQ